jgi:hypothetical protein
MSKRRHNSFTLVNMSTWRLRRTADLPIFRTWDNGSPNTVDVRDLPCRIDLNTDKR